MYYTCIYYISDDVLDLSGYAWADKFENNIDKM